MRFGAATLLVACMSGSAVSSAGPETPLPPLEHVLERLARMAKLYRDNALRFTCDETIYYAGGGHPSLHKFRYIYRYSDEDERLRDYRTPRGRAARKSSQKQERTRLENYGLPIFVKRAYSWAFVFGERHQSLFHYEIEGRDKTHGRSTLRIRFEAIPPYQDGLNEWAGTAWVDRATYQMVRVEAIHTKDLDQYELLQRSLERPLSGPSPRGGSYTFTRVSTDFDVLKNGMRFPGRVVIKRSTHTVSATGRVSVREVPIFHVTQTYKRYRFFGVRTAQQIQRIVEGD